VLRERLQCLRCAAVRVGVVDDQRLPVGAGDLEVLVVKLEWELSLLAVS
jgi:hypothetical protein